jgi:hypothetical protein
MKLTREQAMDLLREWRQKKKLLQGRVTDSVGNNATTFGFIEVLDDRELRIDQRAIAEGASNAGLVVGFDNVEFLFGAWPDPPPKHEGDYLFSYEAFLILTFPNGTKCELAVTNL